MSRGRTFAELPPAVQARVRAQAGLARVGAASPLLEVAAARLRGTGRREQPEHAAQVALFARIDAHPVLSQLPIYAIPNWIGPRTARHGAFLKAEGRRAGVLDINVDVARGGHHGLRVEMKIKPNRLSDDQRVWIERLTAQGYLALVCWSTDEAWDAMLEYLACGKLTERSVEKSR